MAPQITTEKRNINGEMVTRTIYQYYCDSQDELIRVRELLQAMGFGLVAIGCWAKTNHDGTYSEIKLNAGWAWLSGRKS